MSPYDEGFDVPPVPDTRMALRIAGQVAVAGALAGAFEGLALALTSRLLLSPFETLTLALCAVGVDALLGWAFGLAGGLVAQLGLGTLRRSKRYQAGFTIGLFCVAAFFLTPLARELWDRGQRNGAVGMTGLIACITVMFWFNSGFWYRRELLGATPRFGWKLAGGTGAVLLASLSVPLRGSPPVPKEPPPADAPNVVLITIDTLRRDHLGVYGSLLMTPTMDRLGREGVVFEDAITAVPETAPSHASMLTGLPPATHGVVANGIPIPGGVTTATEQLHASGWTTGAFVSSYAVDSSIRLDQGFDVYDDDFLPAFRGVTEIRVARLLLRLLMRFGDPADYPWLLERPGDATIRRALSWVSDTKGPALLWVHLFEPHSPYERHDGAQNPVDHRAILAQEPGYAYTEAEKTALRGLYGHEVEYTDTLVKTLLDGLRAQGKLDNAWVVLLADHGESLGEHEIHFNHHGIYEDVLRVPLILWSSRPPFPAGTRVARQVLVDDIANTVLEVAGAAKLTQTHSVPLLSVVLGTRIPPTPVLLMGRLGRGKEEGRLWGSRDPSGYKYIQDDAGKAELYELATDPGELINLAAEQPDAVAAGQRNVARLRGHLDAHEGPKADAATGAMLEALGYTEPGK